MPKLSLVREIYFPRNQPCCWTLIYRAQQCSCIRTETQAVTMGDRVFPLYPHVLLRFCSDTVSSQFLLETMIKSKKRTMLGTLTPFLAEYDSGCKTRVSVTGLVLLRLRKFSLLNRNLVVDDRIDRSHMRGSNLASAALETLTLSW
jgi:hypothetical protein